MLKKFFKKEKGFTLVETLVAIFILLLATTAPMAVAQSGLRAAYLARDQITAFYLAQDVMEFVKNSKDQAGLDIIYSTASTNSDTWNDSLVECEKTGVNPGCSINTVVTFNNISRCEIGSSPGCIGSSVELDTPLRYNPVDLSYGFGVGYTDTTRFARMTTIDPDSTGKREMKVETRVRWKSNEGVGSREIKVVEYMTNWIGELGDPN